MNKFKALLSRIPGANRVRTARQLRRLRAWSEEDGQRLAFYQRFISPGALVYDVGANVGNRTKVFLRLGARVVAIEPQAMCAITLHALYGDNPRFSLVKEAVGAEPGQAEMMVSETDVLSTLSPEWLEAVQTSGRFGSTQWSKREVVAISTLDSMIAKFGKPDFLKIDVEGFEYEVLRGLSVPVRYLSFEFTPERTEDALRCVERLKTLGPATFNVSLGESMTLSLGDWCGAEDIASVIESYRQRADVFGDIYCAFEL